MDKILLINAAEPEEVRVALIEDGRLEEIYVEAGTDPTAKGNIYVGRVQNVERGIGAAFVELAPGLTGFLHASDVASPVDVPGMPGAEPAPAAAPRAEGVEGAPVEGAGAPAEGAGGSAGSGGGEAGDGRRIQDLLKPGDLVLVQITRGPLGHKGPSITTRISLPGRYVVLLANSTRSGVSRRIEFGDGRDEMRAILRGLELPEGMAVILRTASHGRTREEIQADLSALYRLWETLEGRLLEGGGARLVHAESDLVLRALRDVMPADTTRIVTDDPETAERVRETLAAMAPAAAPPADPVPPFVSAPVPTPGRRSAISDETDAAAVQAIELAAAPRSFLIAPEADAYDGEIQPEIAAEESPPRVAEPPPLPPPPILKAPPPVELHEGLNPLFHAFAVETQVEDAYRRIVRLPSGGSIVIDPTEALVAIDVNSGRMTEEEDLESTALKTDLEAVPEVARQLRLRDLGGVVVIDFIDLRESSHIHQVEQALREALKRDRARIRLGRMGPFGCLELTRQRIRPALASVTHISCHSCGGTGKRRHPVGLALRVLREARARAARARGHGGLEVRVVPAVADVLRKRLGRAVAELERAMKGPFRLVPDPSIPVAGWSIKGIAPRGAPPGPGPRAGEAPPVSGPAGVETP